jgi:hypothetical protein
MQHRARRGLERPLGMLRLLYRRRTKQNPRLLLPLLPMLAQLLHLLPMLHLFHPPQSRLVPKRRHRLRGLPCPAKVSRPASPQSRTVVHRLQTRVVPRRRKTEGVRPPTRHKRSLLPLRHHPTTTWTQTGLCPRGRRPAFRLSPRCGRDSSRPTCTDCAGPPPRPHEGVSVRLRFSSPRGSRTPITPCGRAPPVPSTRRAAPLQVGGGAVATRATFPRAGLRILSRPTASSTRSRRVLML